MRKICALGEAWVTRLQGRCYRRSILCTTLGCSPLPPGNPFEYIFFQREYVQKDDGEENKKEWYQRKAVAAYRNAAPVNTSALSAVSFLLSPIIL